MQIFFSMKSLFLLRCPFDKYFQVCQLILRSHRWTRSRKINGGSRSSWPGWGVVILFGPLAETLQRNVAYFASFQIEASDSGCEKLQAVFPFLTPRLCSVITSFIHADVNKDYSFLWSDFSQDLKRNFPHHFCIFAVKDWTGNLGNPNRAICWMGLGKTLWWNSMSTPSVISLYKGCCSA